jgi:tRNA dimethylallyltransferase
METKRPVDLPLVIIVGPTASGKSTLAIEVAKNFSGEIICADSRTVYRGMDIGTAKPSRAEQIGIPHWGLDIVSPDSHFTVADFKKYADKKIDEIKKRKHIPILVGGTGLYVDAVLFNYQFGSERDEEMRTKLQRLSIAELHQYSIEHNINLPENEKNRRYVIRSIENAGNNIERSSEPRYKNIIVGITTDKIMLRHRIESRIEQQLENGVINEAISLSDKYGWNLESMKSNIYKTIRLYIEGHIKLDDFRMKSATADWRLAKRQLTWLKRNPFIQWLSIEDASAYITEQLAIYK